MSLILFRSSYSTIVAIYSSSIIILLKLIIKLKKETSIILNLYFSRLLNRCYFFKCSKTLYIYSI